MQKTLKLALLLTLTAWAGDLKMVQAARRHLGDAYSADYFSGGYPPQGKSACVDVLVTACRVKGLDLRQLVQQDASCGEYPYLRDRDIDHRWAPNLKVWFRRHARNLPVGKSYEPGDLVFWSLINDGVADHCGVVSDQRGPSGKYQVIHQFPPRCSEEDCLGRWTVVGHYRIPK